MQLAAGETRDQNTFVFAPLQRLDRQLAVEDLRKAGRERRALEDRWRLIGSL